MDGNTVKPALIENATPMMAQYLAIREAHPGYMLFYRMGDFYELFFEDAVKAAEVLDITLTQRGQHNGEPIPMAGVPVKSHESYLERLIRSGAKVAICEQTEDPADAKKRPGKTLVNRDVVRLVTPGTLTEETLLEARHHNFLAALSESGGKLGLAWLDLSTGVFETQSLKIAALAEALARVDPKELLLPDRLLQRSEFQQCLNEASAIITDLPSARFDSRNAERRLKMTFGVEAMDGFGTFERSELSAAGVLIDYIDQTQKGEIARLDPPRRFRPGSVMQIDPATRNSLELFRTTSGARHGSLLNSIDRTNTSAGARLLAGWLAAPLAETGAIHQRQEAVAFFFDSPHLSNDIRNILHGAPDLARALSRLSLDRGGPRDLEVIAGSLNIAAKVSDLLAKRPEGLSGGRQPVLLTDAAASLVGQDLLASNLSNALDDSLPLLARDGGFVARGYDHELDDLCSLRDDSRKLIASLQARYQEEMDVPNLKLKHNAVLGYFIEVTVLHEAKLVSDQRFIRRQTLANAVRFSTVELSDLEGKIAQAADRALARELEIFAELRENVLRQGEALARAADALSLIDVIESLARLAMERAYVQPKVDEGLAFNVKDGRHPVVEMGLSPGSFVPNNCDLSVQTAKRLWLVTGPNMAGKSTYLRQNAIIAILAQIGSFVPASEAHIGVVDKLFSRVGAADDLSRGRSTFMVEMLETAAILNQAGDRSLVILDEIGRGTATYDGLSIAWASVERLHEKNRCRGLFATHYHELTALAEKLDGLGLVSMRVKEWEGDITFLHEVMPGAANRSYGVHVARLAGLPADVVRRATAVLSGLEAGEGPDGKKLKRDLPLFAQSAPVYENSSKPTITENAKRALKMLGSTEVDKLTPRQGMNLLYDLVELVDGWDRFN